MSKRELFVVDDGCIASFMLYELLERDLGVGVVPYNLYDPDPAEEARGREEPCCIVILNASSDERVNLRALVAAWRTVFNATIIVVTAGLIMEPDLSGFKNVVHFDQEEYVERSYDKLLELVHSHTRRHKKRRKRNAR